MKKPFIALVSILIFSFQAQAQQLHATMISGDLAGNARPKKDLLAQAAVSHPEALADAIMWMRNDTVFLFGGRAFTPGAINDQNVNNRLWRYVQLEGWQLIAGDPASMVRTAQEAANTNVNYGSMGVASSSNYPGGRFGAAYGQAPNGDLYMYGGYGVDEAKNVGLLGNLWKFDGQNWTWLSGDKLMNQQSVRTSSPRVTPVSTTRPGGRFQSSLWVDESYNVYVFGGSFDINTYLDHQENLQDLMKWDGVNWSWEGGSQQKNKLEVESNGLPFWPASRRGAAGVYKDGKFYMLGGFGYGTGGGINPNPYFGDLWTWEPSGWTKIHSTDDPNTPIRSANNSLFFIGNNLYYYGVSRWTVAYKVVYDENGSISVDSSIDYVNDANLYRWNSDSTWTLVESYGTASNYSSIGPVGLYHHNVAPLDVGSNMGIVSNGQEAYLFGGQEDYNSTNIYSGFYKFNGQVWAYLSDIGIHNVYLDAAGLEVDMGSRHGAASVYDEQNDRLYLFGGQGRLVNGTSGYLNDLWVFENGRWKWLFGGDVKNQAGSYSNSDPALVYPGSRYGAAMWMDANGDVWVFGGRGEDENGDFGYMNDLWRWDSSAKRWFFEEGSKIRDQGNYYFDLSTFSLVYKVGGRIGMNIWQAPNGDVLLYGGHGFHSSGTGEGYFADFWKWDGNNWTLIGGMPFSGIPRDPFSVSPEPGSRAFSTLIPDGDNGFYLYGGRSYDGPASILTSGLADDLWYYDYGANTWSFLGGSTSGFEVPPTYGVATFNDSLISPGSLENAVGWNHEGNIYLFSGIGSSVNNGTDRSNDFWHWNGTNWAFLKGSGDTSILSKTASVKQGGKGSFEDFPAARDRAQAWQDKYGNLHLLGGRGTTSIGTSRQFLDDHWVLNFGNVWDGNEWSLGSPVSTSANIQFVGDGVTPELEISAKDLLIDANSTLSFSTDTLLVHGDFYNYKASVLDGKPEIRFQGNGSQNIIGDTLSVCGLVLVEQGSILNTHGKLRIAARGVNDYGQLLNLGDVNGELDFEYYLNLPNVNNNGRYCHLGAVLDNVQISDFANGGYLNTGGANPTQNTVWAWDAANANWVSPSDGIAEKGRGYAFYAGSNSFGNFLVANGQNTLRIRGTADRTVNHVLNLEYNSGQLNPSLFLGGSALSQTEGWNLVANPYPHNIDLKDYLGPLINKSIYIWNGASYAIWNNGVRTNNGSSIIAPGQAFYIQVAGVEKNSLTGLSINGGLNGARGIGQRFKAAESINQIDGFYLELQNDSLKLDELWLGFNQFATEGFDGAFDAWKLSDAQASISISMDSAYCSIATYPYDSLYIVPLHLDAVQYQGDTLEVEIQSSSFKAYSEVFLEDHLLDKSQNLLMNPVYRFVNDSAWADRFSLRFGYSTVHQSEETYGSEVYFYQFDDALRVDFTSLSMLPSSVKVYNTAGQLVERYSNGDFNEVLSCLKGQSPGVYLIHYTLPGGVGKILKAQKK